MDSLAALLKFGFSTRIAEDPDAQSPRGRALKAQQALLDVLRRFKAMIDGIDADTRFTAQGKAEKKKELVEATIKETQTFKPLTLTHIEQRLAEVRDKFARGQAPKDEGIGEILTRLFHQKEVRDHLRAAGPQSRVQALKQAIERRDEQTVGAFLDDPIGDLVHPQLLEEARRDWQRAQNPALADEITELESLAKTLTVNFADVASGINELAGNKPDLRERIEAGQGQT